MSNPQILTKYFLLFLLKAIHSFFVLVKKILGTKTLLLVSKQKIKSFSIGPTSQIIAIGLIIWVANTYIKSVRYSHIIEAKSEKIENITKANKKFENQLDALSNNLQNISIYFKSLSSLEDTKISTPNQEIDKKLNDLFGQFNFQNKEQKIANKFAKSHLILDDIKNSTIARINDLEEKLAIAGVGAVDNVESLKQDIVSLNNGEDQLSKQGGPFKDLASEILSANGSEILNFAGNKFSIKDEINYLTNLEKFIRFAPLAAPMNKNEYYVSSVFGKRIDPIKRVAARHEGMDFAGKLNAKIISPSMGRVKFVGRKGSYGKMIVIDHGYGLTTRYGHLSKIHVKKGQIVKKSQIVATQGSTGRSTGQHLHYEIRYKNIPLNPKKFLRAGQEIAAS